MMMTILTMIQQIPKKMEETTKLVCPLMIMTWLHPNVNTNSVTSIIEG